MRAKIIQESNSSTQNAPIEKSFWHIRFDVSPSNLTVDSLTGWTGSSDSNSQIDLRFPNLDSALAYAKEHEFEYEILKAFPKKLVKKAYSDNFK